LNLVDKFKMIHGIIFRTDMVLKKYISLSKGTETIINIPKGFKHCKNYHSDDLDENDFVNEINIEADLIIFLVAEWVDNDVLATAAPCRVNEQNRAYVGRIYLNMKNLQFEYGNYFEQRAEILTLFHETLHILAFNPTLQSGLHSKLLKNEIDRQFINLYLFKNLSINPLDGDKHWDPVYMGNDIMSPNDRADETLTVFTLEYLDLVSPQIKTDRSALPNNFLFDEINDFKDYFKYQCTDEEERAKYSAFCSPLEAETNKFSCDRSRLYKTTCGEDLLSNNCYHKIPNPKYVCANENMSEDNIKFFETYGVNSRCFNTQVGKSNKNSSHCMEFEINEQGVLIKAEGMQYQCKTPGEYISLVIIKDKRRHKLNVQCPEPEEFQTLYNLTNCPENCYGNGFCSNGKCDCFNGFDPVDHCKTKTISTATTRFTNAL